MTGLPAPAPEALHHSRRLTGHIRAAIDAEGGWISFARYMELALYAPALGYYAGGAEKFGTGGDFITAPALTPLFGRVLARQFAPVLTATGGGILELGAGTGRLAAQIRSELHVLGIEAPYAILDVSADLRARQQETLQAVPGSAQGEGVTWLDALPETFTGIIFGNEVLDALPVHLLKWTGQGPLERGVITLRDGFAWEDRPITDPTLRGRALALNLPAGYLSEINLAAPALTCELGRRLGRGLLLFIDYGFGRSEYYHPQRHMGTLRAHYRHHALDDPFYLPGLCDLTAHVDFSAIAEAGMKSGLQLAGYTSQANFLLNAGITDLLLQTSPAEAAAYLPQANAVQRLVSPAEMGELFKVIAFTKEIEMPLTGFSRGDRCHAL